MKTSPRLLAPILVTLALGLVTAIGCSQDPSGNTIPGETAGSDGPGDEIAADGGEAPAVEQANVEQTADAEETVAARQPPLDTPPEPLMIGSPAPELDIEHWIQDGKGQFAKVSEFEEGKVYVVEFWATWCGPCIASMPHIAELQRSYADRGVQVVSITREDPETVEGFLARTVQGSSEGEEDAPTYRDLTSVYCLTSDPDSSTSRDYMTAAKQNGIPCAFIVGKDSKIEWIGHPMSMDEPLEKVVTDAWNRDVFAQEFEAQQALQVIMRGISSLMRSGDTEGAIATIDEAMQDPKLSSEKARLGMLKFQLLAADEDSRGAATNVAMEILEDDGLDASGVNQIAWTISELSRQKRFHSDELMQAAIDRSLRAVEGAGQEKPALLDTIAHLQYASGDLETALATQQSAVELADAGMKPRLTPFLKQLERELEAKNAPPKEDPPKEEEDQVGETDAEESAESKESADE